VRSFQKHAFTFCVLSMFVTLASVPLKANDLTNGGFESSYFRSWNVDNQSAGFGSFFVVTGPTGTITPISRRPTAGAAGGAFFAVSDQEGPGASALSQFFTIPAGSSEVILSFDMFVNDWSGSGPIVNPAGLDYSAFPNQHARVDILSGDAPAFDTGDGILRNLYLGVDAGNNPHPYTHYEFDITDVVGAGGTFRLRFAQVDNLFFLNMGVDNVAIRRGRGAREAAPETGPAAPQEYPPDSFLIARLANLPSRFSFDGAGSGRRSK
jgi:hypothetical protein